MSDTDTLDAPAATLPRVDLDAITKGALWNPMFFDAGDYWQKTAVCKTFPSLVVVDQGPRGRGRRVKRNRKIYYRGELFETLAAVVVAINRERGHET